MYTVHTNITNNLTYRLQILRQFLGHIAMVAICDQWDWIGTDFMVNIDTHGDYNNISDDWMKPFKPYQKQFPWYCSHSYSWSCTWS